MAERSYGSTKPGSLKVFVDAVSLSRAAADEISACAAAAIGDHGRFAWVLSGGTTPRAVYSLLAAEQTATFPWDKTFLFFGDERHVPPDHPESNYRMAWESMISKVPLPAQNVFRIPAELDADAAARQYEERLREFFALQPGEWPRFDLVLLGLGDDGHTASLFPGTAALDESSRLVVANHVEKLQTERITLTFPVLNHAAEVVFLVSGQAKAKIFAEIFSPASKHTYPAQRIQPVNGRLLWIADQPAVSLL